MASKKHYPVQRTFRINETATGTGRTVVKLICVNDLLSRVNRRLYRQGRYYKVKVTIDGDQMSSNRVFTLRDTWDVQKAYQMAYKQYLDNTKEERARLGKKQIARWEDFKVDHGFDLVSTTGPTTLWADYMEAVGNNYGIVPSNFGVGENTVFSKVVDQAGQEKTFSWLNPGSANHYSVLGEYANAANTQSSPSSTTTSGPYEDLNSEVNAATMDALQDDGNAPPYDASNNATDRLWFEHPMLMSVSTGAQRLSTGYITAPCGFILVTANDDEVADIMIEVQGGDYKGVHALSMLE